MTRPARRPRPSDAVRLTCIAAASLVLALVAAPRAEAQDDVQGLRRPFVSFSLGEPSPFLPSNGIVTGRVTPVPPLPLGASPAAPAARRATLYTLEASFAALQVLDAVSTLKAIDRGHSEQNPLMRGLVDRPAAFLAVKAGATVTTLWLVHRVARQNTLAAILTLAAIDSGYAMLVSRNLQALRR
jgi:hypothetical protein